MLKEQTMSAAQKTAADKKEIRRRMYAKAHATWGNLRKDLKKGSDDYKEALYMFAEAELRKPRIASLTELTQPELIRLIDALVREEKQPRLPQAAGANVLHFTPKHSSASDQSVGGQVEHLASIGQRKAINSLFGYLGWSEFGRESFLQDRFRCKRVEMLLHKQAHSCIRILLNCAGSKYWKAQDKERVSQPMIRAAIPQIKRELGIN